MKAIFESYDNEQDIPIKDHIKGRKLVKYFNRETKAALVAVDKLLKENSVPKNTPVYYAMGIIEYEDYGLETIYNACKDEGGSYSQELFIKKAMGSISPLTQFKVLYNMTLCFISIEHGFIGDNASIYSSASGLLLQALCAKKFPALIGAGKVHDTGKVETGFAVVTKDDIKNSPFLNSGEEAIEIFRSFQGAPV